MSQIPLRKGMFIRHQGRVLVVNEFREHHTGRGRPTVHVGLRDVRDNHTIDRTLDDLLPIEEVERRYRQVQFLYPRGGAHVFMDAATFDELELSAAQLQGSEPFLVAGSEYRLMELAGQPFALELPEIIVATVEFTAPAEHSVGTAANITKEARLENGLEVRVPLFIKTGDQIRIDTRTRTYAGKDHG
ncbi:MAG: hypothetical protein U1A27_14010 [Phycisphaerae bacterium]